MNEPHQDHDLQQVLDRIRTWKQEATRFRNDGYVQQGNKDRLKKVKTAVSDAIKEIENKD